MHGSWSSSLAALIFDDMCVKKSDHRHRRLLRARRERPRNRAAEKGYELAPSHHAITSSALASSVGGKLRATGFAILKPRTSSKSAAPTASQPIRSLPVTSRPIVVI